MSVFSIYCIPGGTGGGGPGRQDTMETGTDQEDPGRVPGEEEETWMSLLLKQVVIIAMKG